MSEGRIPKQIKSYWRETAEIPSYPALQENISTEVAVVGGGITGIITAYLLTKAGKKVALIDAGKLLDGVTGYTTAKITSQHSIVYAELIKTMGEEKARLYYEANEEALKFIRDTAEELSIDCDLMTQDSYIYSESSLSKKLVEKEGQAYEQLGINGGFAKEEVQLPYPVTEAIVIRDQAQFHPLKFLAPLIKEIEKNGGSIYENTRATKVVNHKDPVIRTENMSHISCDKLVVASHYPFNDADGLYFSRLEVSRSYIIAAKTDRNIPEGMYHNADLPARSLRYAVTDEGEKLLLIGGDGHRTGKSKTDTFEHYENLADFGERYFGIKEIPYRWSAQDMTTLDKVPYIGTSTAGFDNILVATGYHKWGMSSGTLAGMLLSDQILGKENRYAHVFNPMRTKLKVSDAARFAKTNAVVAKELAKGKLQRPSKTPQELAQDEGSIVTVKGKRAGGYKDEYGQVHLVDTTCTHMGCETNWNQAERSWDCPCHGSRFSYTGEVLEGPAVKPLKRVDE